MHRAAAAPWRAGLWRQWPARAAWRFVLATTAAASMTVASAAPAAAEGQAVAQAAGAGSAPSAAARTPPPLHTVPDTLAERVKPCAACHGREGVATRDGYFPRIAGKPAGYLYNQLVNFRDGRRENAAMVRFVQFMSDAYLMEIANHFAALELPYPPPPPRVASADELARGRQLVEEGDATRGLPACARCHGAAMTGAAPAMPGLVGLPRDYLLAQFGAWRNGERRAVAPDCMHEIAGRLSPEDLGAVATYLSQQAVPADAKPAATLVLPLPIDCGSGLR